MNFESFSSTNHYDDERRADPNETESLNAEASLQELEEYFQGQEKIKMEAGDTVDFEDSTQVEDRFAFPVEDPKAESAEDLSLERMQKGLEDSGIYFDAEDTSKI